MQRSLKSTHLPSIVGALVPRSTTWVNLAVDAALIVGFAALTGLMAQVAIYVNPAVPITGQTFAVLLAGAVLGGKKGSASMAVYLVMGVLGIPVFAPTGAIPGASRGYFLGFIAAAAIVGYLCERGWARNPLYRASHMISGRSSQIERLFWGTHERYDNPPKLGIKGAFV